MFVQKFKFILMKMHKNCCHQSCSFGSDSEICTKFVGWRFAPDPNGGAYSAPPGLLAGLGVDPPGKGRREGGGKGGTVGSEREGRESRNAQIKSWQAYHYPH